MAPAVTNVRVLVELALEEFKIWIVLCSVLEISMVGTCSIHGVRGNRMIQSVGWLLFDKAPPRTELEE